MRYYVSDTPKALRLVSSINWLSILGPYGQTNELRWFRKRYIRSRSHDRRRTYRVKGLGKFPPVGPFRPANAGRGWSG